MVGAGVETVAVAGGEVASRHILQKEPQPVELKMIREGQVVFSYFHFAPTGSSPRVSARSVIVDVAVDQGGCVETCHPTTHEDPTYVVDGVIHCCVANMPGAVPNTSTLALTNSTFPYVAQIATLGAEQAMLANKLAQEIKHLQTANYAFRGGGGFRVRIC